MAGKDRRLMLKDLLTKEQIRNILDKSIEKNVHWELKGSELQPEMDGIAGFLSEHMKAVLHLDVRGEQKEVHLFLKCLPVGNKPKADFIDGQGYFGREALMYKLLEEMSKDDPNQFCAEAYIYTDSIIVMPDLTRQGYFCRPYLDILNREHVLVATTSIALFHAALVNYETKMSLISKQHYSTVKEFGHLLKEPIFCDCPWLKACAKLSANLLKKFSEKYHQALPDLEAKLEKKYLEACNSLTEYKDTVNILIHRDLWVNNIMFYYENDVPTKAVLIDFQNLRYGPPSFDLLTFLYLTTDRTFRNAHESDVLDHYYAIFTNNINDNSKRRLGGFGYDKEDFLKWCEKGRMFSMLEAIGIYPYCLLDPRTAEKTFSFDDIETHEKHFNEDRSELILDYASRNEIFKRRNVEVCEEFVEAYLLSEL